MVSCERLMSDADAIHDMERQNEEYYNNHLRPDKVILDSLNTVFDAI